MATYSPNPNSSSSGSDGRRFFGFSGGYRTPGKYYNGYRRGNSYRRGYSNAGGYNTTMNNTTGSSRPSTNNGNLPLSPQFVAWMASKLRKGMKLSLPKDFALDDTLFVLKSWGYEVVSSEKVVQARKGNVVLQFTVGENIDVVQI